MRTILLVEDDHDARVIFTDALTKRGYRVLVATHGAEGVSLARRQHPDLILMDLRMPVMDGLTALRYLKADKRTAGIPVWAISAHFADEKDNQPFLARFDHRIPKPVAPDELVAELDYFFLRPAPTPPEIT